MKAQKKFKCGPSGGKGGKDFEDTPRLGTKIAEISIWAGDVVEGIRITWSGGDYLEHGSCSGDPKQPVVQLRDDEYLVAISGKYGEYIDHIKFYTSKENEYEYGGSHGDVEFDYNADLTDMNAHIIGFFGRAQKVVDAIGCIFALKD